MVSSDKNNSQKLLLGVCACSQAEHTLQFVNSVRQIIENIEIILVATHAATHFFDIEKVERVIGRTAFIGHRDFTPEFEVPHIQLAEWPDAVLVYPASASTLAKCAHGICDNLISNIVLATKKPVFFGPSMNEAMYENSITQKNIQTLINAGYEMVPRVERPIYVYSQKETVVKPFCTIPAAIYSIKTCFENS